MRIDLKIAAGLMMVIAGVTVGTVLALSLGGASSSGEESRYEVTVRFNTSVTQDDIDEAAALLRAYDEAMEFVVMESFPPIGRALVATAADGFCPSVEADLEAKSYVDDVTCGPWQEPDRADPDAPVSSDHDLRP